MQKEKLDEIIKYLDEKHAKDPVLIDVRQKTEEMDYFIILSALNTTHINALKDSIEKKMFELDYEIKKVEGKSLSGWVILDYGDIVFHVFDKTSREHYDLERLWQ